MKYVKTSILCIIVGIELLLVVGILQMIVKNRVSWFRAKKYLLYFGREVYVFPGSAHFSLFYEPKPKSEIVWDQPWVTEKARTLMNADGLNNTKNYSYKKAPGVFRILAIGDSFTFGPYVNTKDTYPEKLESILTRFSCGSRTSFEVLNFGVGAYDIGYTVERYLRHGRSYNPDAIVWLINPHNLLQLRDEITKREYEIINSMSDEAYMNLQKSTGDKYYAATKATEEIQATFGKSVVFQKQKEFFEHFFAAYAGPLVILSYSGLDEDMKTLLLESTAKRENTVVAFTLPFFYDTAAAFVEGHPNILGHSMIADMAARVLFENRIISCQP